MTQLGVVHCSCLSSQKLNVLMCLWNVSPLRSMNHIPTQSTAWPSCCVKGAGWLTYYIKAVLPALEVDLRLLPDADHLHAHAQRHELLVAYLRLPSAN